MQFKDIKLEWYLEMGGEPWLQFYFTSAIPISL